MMSIAKNNEYNLLTPHLALEYAKKLYLNKDKVCGVPSGAVLDFTSYSLRS